MIALLGILVTAAAAAQEPKPVKGQGCVAAGVEASCLVVKDVKTGVLYNLFFKGTKPAVGTGIEFTGVPSDMMTNLHAGQAARSVQLVARGCAQVPIKPGAEAVDPDRATEPALSGTAPGFPLAALRVSYQEERRIRALKGLASRIRKPKGSPAHLVEKETMNPVGEQTREQARRTAFQETLLSARQTMMMSEILKLAADSFRASKTRFALTALGMVIGTASVILVVTIGLTGKQYVLELLQKIGTNQVEVEYAGGGATAAERARYTDYLTQEDEKAVDQQVPGIMYSSPVLEMHNRVSFPGGIQKDTVVLGVNSQYQFIRNLIVTDGRFFDETDDTMHIKCAVVSAVFCAGAIRQLGRGHRPNFPDSGHSLHHHRRLQRERFATSACRRSPTKPSWCLIRWRATLPEPSA